MEVHQAIRTLRELKKISPETVAERIPMSISGYKKLERGENKLVSDKLFKIVEILDVDIVDFIYMCEKDMVYLVNENNQFSFNHYHSNEQVVAENEKLKIKLQAQEELLNQQKREIETLQDMIKLLKQTHST